LFITLPQNNVAVKVESSDDVIEENSIDLKTDQVYAPYVCSIEEAEPKVSFAFR
jgi:hypothetical protein